MTTNLRFSKIKSALPGGLLFILQACTAGDVFHQANRSVTTDLTLLGATAQPIVRNPDGTICYGPPPDATIDEDVASAMPSFSVGVGDNEIPIGGRNPNVLITRDIFFQACLAEARLQLTPAERKKLFYKVLETVQTVNSATLEGAYVTSDATSGQTIVAPQAVPLQSSGGSNGSY